MEIIINVAKVVGAIIAAGIALNFLVYMAVGGFYSARTRYRKDDKSGYKLHDVNLNIDPELKESLVDLFNTVRRAK